MILFCISTTTVLRPFVRDYPGEPVPEETLVYHQSNILFTVQPLYSFINSRLADDLWSNVNSDDTALL